MQRSRSSLREIGLVLSLLTVAVPAWSANTLQRDHEPVVLSGDLLGGLRGADPAAVAGFRREAGGWVRIPVQVDERTWTTFDTVYGTTGISDSDLLTYADPSTHVGADDDPSLEA